MIGKVIKQRYRIYDEIGQGSVAAVYLAKDLAENRVVALKIIQPELAKEQDFARRFRREAKLLTKLDSPHAVKVLDYGSDQGVDFIVLEYVEGKTLKAILDEGGPLGVERALDVARQVAQCLADAHEKGIVHRDIRPANLMLTADGGVKVMDFGVAQGADLSKLTATGVLGSPHYLSPEQAEGKRTDIRSDIYSLGVTLFEMLADKRPYEGESAVEVVLRHLQEPVPSLRELDEGIPTEVDELVRKCLAKKPGERYQTPSELLAAIGDVMRVVGVEEKPSIGIEDALAGQTLGQYRLLERIGRGGMATVYKGYQPSLDRYVAVKVLPQYFAHDPSFAARFEREAKAIAKLDHPNILPVHDFGREGDLTYIVMKYVEAGTLKDTLGQPMPPDQAVDIISQVAGALDHAHRQGVIHRDVKPSNVLMSETDWALLSDFGLARMVEASVQLTKTGVGVGTPAYMSPEQGQGIAVDARSDVYSLGVMLYEMLTGRVPYEAETPMAVVIKHITAPLPLPREVNPAIPETVERVILKAMAKDPADRFQSAGELAKALKKAAAGVEVVAEPERPPVVEGKVAPVAPKAIRPVEIVEVEEERKPLRSPSLLVGVGVLALVLIVAVGALLVSRAGRGEAIPSPTSMVLATEPKATAEAAGTEAAVASPTATLVSRILYSVSEGDAESLYATDLDGSGPHLLASGADSVSGRFSPDEDRVIVSLKRGDNYSLYLMKADGGDRQVLVSDQYSARAYFSENGEKIIAQWREKQGDAFFENLVVMEADGSNPVTLVSDAPNYISSSWARDGQKVALSVKEGDQNVLYVVNSDGSERKTIARGGSRSYSPRLSDDGQKLSYETREGDVYNLYLANADGSQPVELATGVYSVWVSRSSPSGGKLLIEIKETTDAPYDLYIVDTASGQRLRLLSDDDVWGDFSPDGQWVWAGAGHEGLERLYVISADGAQRREILGPVEDADWGSFSPDEQWVVVDAQHDGLYRLYVFSADGAQQREIVGPGEGGDWYSDGFFSPDGQRLLVRLGYQEPCCGSSLYVMAADGSQRVELARDAEWELSASFTSDGQYIIFDSNREGGRAIYVADADGRNVHKLIEGYGPIVASGVPPSMWARPRPAPTPTPTTERTATPTRTPKPTKTPTPTKTPKPTKTPTPRPTSPPSTSLTLQTSSPSSVDAGQSVTLGLRNKWGTPGETHSFECIVVAPDGSQSTAQGTLKSDQWAYMNYPDDFGPSSTGGGEYQFTCHVEGQQVKGRGFTVVGPSAPADPEREAAINQLRAGVEARNAEMLMPMAYGGSMVFGYFESGNAIQTESPDEKRATTQRWLTQWAMQYVETGAEELALRSISQGIAAHKEATDRAVIIFRTGEQASSETPQVIFLLEKIGGRWWWTSMLLAIFDL